MQIQDRTIIEQLGSYHIYKHIAKGGMARVSLAYQHTDLGLQRRVVIKSVLPHLSEELDFITMFLDEARLMMSFSHPYVAQVFDIGVIDRKHFLSMEYIPGPTLAQALKLVNQNKELIPYEVCFTIAFALTEALKYVHQQSDAFGNSLSIIHRDLKPSNVLLREDGVIKLIDFGIAQAASKKHKTRTGVIKGTIGYLAPEQILDEAVDQRADVFTLGLLLFQIFVGRYPFPGKNDAIRLRRLMKGDSLDPQEYRANFPERLNQLLKKCLAATPQERPFMSELLEELVECARDMSLVPHAQILEEWLSHRFPKQQETNPEYLVQSLQNTIDETIQSQYKQSVQSTPQKRVKIESAPTREEKIDARIEDFHPLIGSDTLFDHQISSFNIPHQETDSLDQETDQSDQSDQPDPFDQTELSDLSSIRQSLEQPVHSDSIIPQIAHRKTDEIFLSQLKATTPALPVALLKAKINESQNPHAHTTKDQDQDQDQDQDEAPTVNISETMVQAAQSMQGSNPNLSSSIIDPLTDTHNHITSSLPIQKHRKKSSLQQKIKFLMMFVVISILICYKYLT